MAKVVIVSSGQNADWLHAASPRSMVGDVLLGRNPTRYPTDAEIDAWMLVNPIPGHPLASEPRPAGTKLVEILGADKTGRLVVLSDEWGVHQGVRYVRAWERDGGKYGPPEYADAVLALGGWGESKPRLTDRLQADWDKAEPGLAAVIDTEELRRGRQET